MTVEGKIRLAVPSKGALEVTTLAFLAECGMKVNRSNPRQYLARIDSLPDLEVVFQRAADIPLQVQEEDAMLGITGYDILAEHRGVGGREADEDSGDSELIVLEPDLGYGQCSLVVAVPEDWIDVSTCADLWHLAGFYQEKGRNLRIATKYPALTKQFLHKLGITRYKLVTPHGAIEAAPLTKMADFIVDLTETGTTLRENHLKLLDDGEVLQSRACLIANTRLLRQNEQAQRVTAMILELIEAHKQARKRSLLTAYMQSESDDEKKRVCAKLFQRLKSLVSSSEFQVSDSELASNTKTHSYTISCVVNVGSSASELLEIVAIFRSAGALRIDTTPLQYRFAGESISVRALRERLKRIR